jgi:hypothetical protein
VKDTILEEIQAYKGPTKVPPIADKAAALYEAAGFKLDEDTTQVLRQELAKHAGDLKSLTDAIIGLSVFALFLRDDRKDSASAEAIVRLIGEHAPKYFPIGERIVGALQDMSLKASDLFDQFSGRLAEKKRAPKYGEAGPAGSISLKQLKPMTNPLPQPRRPPVKKK